MSATVDMLKEQSGKLSTHDRAELAYFLLHTLDDQEAEGEVESAWRSEVRRRFEAIRAGKVKGKPVEEVFDAVREKYA